MRGLFSQRRISQPQSGANRVDWSNPRTSGLSFAFSTLGSDLAASQISNIYTTGVTLTAGRLGLAMDIASTSAQNGLTVAAGIDLSLQTGGCTLIVVVDGITPGAGSAQGFIGPDTSNFFGYDTSGFPIIKAGGSTQATSSVALSTTVPNVIAYTYLRGQAAKIYLNGVLVANATPGSVGIDYKPTLFGHTTATSTHGRHRIYGAALFSRRMLDDVAVMALSANLWQVFAPSPRQWLLDLGTTSQSFSYTPTGGITIAGASTLINTRIATGNGGITFSGAATVTRIQSRIVTPLGGLSFSGTASEVLSIIKTPSGGILFGGSSIVILSPDPTPNIQRHFKRGRRPRTKI